MLELWFPDNSPYFSSGTHALLRSLTGSILLGKSLQCSPALQKAGFPGCSTTPLNVSSTTCPDPAGIRQGAGAPATSCPEAHFLHPGRGGRQTSEGGRAGRELRGPPPLRPAGEGPNSDPGCSWRARRKHRSFPLTQRQRSGRAPLVKGPGKLRQGNSGDPQKCAVTEGWVKAGGRLQLRGRMRPATCRPSSEEAGEREPGRWPREGAPEGGRCRRRGGPPPDRFP